MMGLVWPYVECHHVLNLLVAKIRPWLDMVEWGQLKAKGECLHCMWLRAGCCTACGCVLTCVCWLLHCMWLRAYLCVLAAALHVAACLLVCAGRRTAVFTEEGQADYDFALGGDMTADAFARAVRGQRGGAPPPPHPHASGPGDAPSSTVPPVPEQPFPEGGSSLAQGIRMSCRKTELTTSTGAPRGVGCASFVG